MVTGASRGLGRAIAVALAEAGADVALAGRSKPDLEETARRVQAQARRALVAPTDVSVLAEVEALVARAVSDLGRLDIVVNNAGVAKVAPLVEMTDADLRGIVDTNLIGVINGCRAAAPHLIGQGRGKVINVASVLAVVGLPGYSIYSATKGGIIAFTRALGVEWARHGIQVNALAPGWFATDMTDPALSNPRGQRAAHPRHPHATYRSAARGWATRRAVGVRRVGLYDRADHLPRRGAFGGVIRRSRDLRREAGKSPRSE